MADGMPSERRDVRIEDILEVSKKTFTSFPSSFRTGRDGEVGFNNPSKNSNKEQD